jgi:hypothetical protein
MTTEDKVTTRRGGAAARRAAEVERISTEQADLKADAAQRRAQRALRDEGGPSATKSRSRRPATAPNKPSAVTPDA